MLLPYNMIEGKSWWLHATGHLDHLSTRSLYTADDG